MNENVEHLVRICQSSKKSTSKTRCFLPLRESNALLASHADAAIKLKIIDESLGKKLAVGY